MRYDFFGKKNGQKNVRRERAFFIFVRFLVGQTRLLAVTRETRIERSSPRDLPLLF